MRAEAALIRRLHRLERVRAQAKHAAAMEAARAEDALTQIEALAARTRSLADDYRNRTSQASGLELRQVGQFLTGISGISASADGNTAQARADADQKQQELALAERRRAAVEDRARAGARALAKRLETPVLSPRRAVGTGLE